MLRKRLIALTAILEVAVTCMYYPNLAVERLKEYVGWGDKKEYAAAVALGQEEDKKTTEVTEEGGGKWYTPGPDGKLIEVPNRLKGLKPEDLVPAVKEAAPDSTTIESVVKATVEPDQPAIESLESKVADPVLPEGAEKIDISKVEVGPNNWEKGRANVEGTPLLSTEYFNKKIKEIFYLQFSGMGDDMTFYKVYSGKDGDKSSKAKAPSKLPDGYEQIGTIKIPIGTKDKEEKFKDMVNFFYHILKMCEEKELKGHIVYVDKGNEKDSYAYILPP